MSERIINEVKVIRAFGRLELGDILKYDKNRDSFILNKYETIIGIEGLEDNNTYAIRIAAYIVYDQIGDYFEETNPVLVKDRKDKKLKNKITEVEDDINKRQSQIDELLDQLSELNKKLEEF